MTRTPLLYTATAFLLGILLFWWLRPPFLGLCLIVVMICGLFFLVHSRHRISFLLLFLIALLGAFRAFYAEEIPPHAVVSFLSKEARPVTCEGIVVSEIEWGKSFHGRMRPQGWLKITLVQEAREWMPVQGTVRLRMPPVGPFLSYGDRVVVHGTIRLPHSPGKGDRFDEKNWLWVHGACGSLSLTDPTAVVHIESSHAWWDRFRRGLTRFREGLKQKASPLLGSEDNAYLEGLVLGEKSGFSTELNDIFRKTGTIHVLVVSGMHVGLVALVSFVPLSLLPIPRTMRYLSLSGILVIYCILTGANPPIVRSTITGVLLCAASARGKVSSALNFLGAAVLLILMINPRTLADPSFQMSFASVLGILMVTPWLLKRGRPAPRQENERPRPWERLCVKSIQALAVSAGAWLALFPIVAWHFRMVTPIALVANLIVVPWSSLLVVIGFVVYAVAFFSPMVAAPAALSFSWMCWGLTKIVTWLSCVPGGSWNW